MEFWVKSDIVEVCPWACSSSSHSPGSVPAAAWMEGGLTPAWTTQEHLKPVRGGRKAQRHLPLAVKSLALPEVINKLSIAAYTYRLLKSDVTLETKGAH